jgi:hypothetical protein
MKSSFKLLLLLFVSVLCGSGITHNDKSKATYNEEGSKHAFHSLGWYVMVKDTSSYAAGMSITPTKASTSNIPQTVQLVQDNSRHEVLKNLGSMQLSGPALVTAFHF